MIKILLLSVFVLISGCGTLEFLRCGDGGYCLEGSKYGCCSSKACLEVLKAKCLKENRTWNEEYGFCEYPPK